MVSGHAAGARAGMVWKRRIGHRDSAPEERRKDEIGLVAVGEIDLANLRRPVERCLDLLGDGVEVARLEPSGVLDPDRLRQGAGERARLIARGKERVDRGIAAQERPQAHPESGTTRSEQRCQRGERHRLGELAPVHDGCSDRSCR